MLKKWFLSFKKGWKRDFLKSNKFIKVFLPRIEEMKQNFFLDVTIYIVYY